MNLKVANYAPDLCGAWNIFNSEARNGHFLFDRRFMEYHADRFQDASSVVRTEDGAIVGLFPANMTDDHVCSHGGLTFGGLVLGAARLPLAMQALDALAEFYGRHGFHTLVYKPLPHIYHRRPAEDDLYWLTRNGARLVRRDVSSAIVCAAPGPLSSRRKRGADRAAKAGLRFARSDRWPEFWTVLETTLAERHGVRPVHELEEIVKLAAALPDNIRLHLADRGEEVLAGVVTFESGPVMHAQYIAASSEGRSLGALDGLFRHLIAAAGEQGAAVFDFGISTEEQGRFLNEGLVIQKEEFGASAVVYDVYELVL